MTPHTRCRLKLLKLERIKDYLLMEEEFIKNQERLKPQEEKQEVCSLKPLTCGKITILSQSFQDILNNLMSVNVVIFIKVYFQNGL